jgi:hypothetical protein
VKGRRKSRALYHPEIFFNSFRHDYVAVIRLWNKCNF